MVACNTTISSVERKEDPLDRIEKRKESYKKLEHLLNKHDVKASELAAAIGTDPSTFTHWKHGEYMPKIEKIMKICDYFEEPITYFYGD